MVKAAEEQRTAQEEVDKKAQTKKRISASRGMSPDQFAAAVSRGEIA